MLSRKSTCSVLTVSAAALLVLAFIPTVSLAQDATGKKDKADHDQHANHAQAAGASLAEQLRALQTKVAVLEAALKQNHQAMQKSSGMQMGSMGGGKMGMGKGMEMMSKMKGMSGQGMDGMGMGKMGMGGMGMGEMGMGGMSGMGMMSGGMSGQDMSGMGGMGMGMMGGKGMSMMGQMQGMGQMQMPSALPGFAGASHIYHVGATSFFLDHPQHITLTPDQQIKLNQIKEKTLLGQATSDRWISQGEQELWVLTSSDAPKAAEIEAKIREIEKLRGDKRFAYIRAVGEAASVLTNEQRQTLVGLLPSDHATGADKQN